MGHTITIIAPGPLGHATHHTIELDGQVQSFLGKLYTDALAEAQRMARDLDAPSELRMRGGETYLTTLYPATAGDFRP